MKFAFVLNDEVVEIREYPSQPSCKMINGLPVIRPLEDPGMTEDDLFDGYEVLNNKVKLKYKKKTQAQKDEEKKQKDKVKKATLRSEIAYSTAALLDCLLAKGVITGTEPEIADLMAKKAEMEAIQD